uniref:HSF_DOMAIN domain-containing protein n=1 Tax=Mesocestoides corti TaxID=53468 RepID=A0A5K3FPT5_MESCO
MHNQGCNIPAFLSKLKILVDDPQTDELIYWDSSGRSFHIRDGNRLAKEILPLFFKHNNLSSFIRQLNMYGFKKINRADPVLGLSSDIEDMEFSHTYFIRHNTSLLSKIHRRPPSYNLAANLLNSHLCNNAPVSTSTVQDHVAANGSHRIILGTEFNRLSELVRQMRARQESTTHQMHVLRSENQLLYREMAHLRNQLEQQGQLIQTLFNFLSAIATERRNSGIRIGSGKRKLALTDMPSVSDNQTDLMYDWDTKVISEKARLLAANPQIQKMLFAQPSSALPATSDGACVLSRCNSPRVQVISNPSSSTPVLSSSSILAIQDASSPKRPRTDSSVVHRILPKEDLSNTSITASIPDLPCLDVRESVNEDAEDGQDSTPFHYNPHCSDQPHLVDIDSFDQQTPLSPIDYQLSSIEPTVQSGQSGDVEVFPNAFMDPSQRFICDSSTDESWLPPAPVDVMDGSVRRNATRSNTRNSSKLKTSTKSPTRRSSTIKESSPTLTNIHKEDNLSAFYLRNHHKVSSTSLGGSPQKADVNSSMPVGSDEAFVWEDVVAEESVGNDSPSVHGNADGLLINDMALMTSSSPLNQSGHLALTNREINDDDDAAAAATSPLMLHTVLTSPEQIDQNDILDSLFADPPLKSISSSIPSPGSDIGESLLTER